MKPALLAAAIFAAVPPGAAAQDHPDIVRSRIAAFDKGCRDKGGTPGARREGAIVVRDIDGDGRDDWIVDYRHFTCEGAANPYCGKTFCAIDVHTVRDGKEVKPLLMAEVATWRTGRVDGLPALILTQSGAFCGMKKPTCTVTYTFRAGTMHGRMK